MRLQADHVNWSIDGKPILRDVSLAVESGSITGLIGPNGSGKSTLLRCIYRAQKPDSGTITLDGHDLIRMDSRESARRIAVVLQEYPSDFQFTVGEIVSMGRNPHKGMFDRDTPTDRGIIRDALARVGLAGFSHRNFNTLSGGEKQRVIIARTLAQQPTFLVLDEPTNHLDIRYQLETMELVRDLGLTTLAALHDLNIAADYCDFIHVIDGGRIVASGRPAEVLHPDIIADVFGVGSSVGEDTMTGRLRISFYLNGHSPREAAAARFSWNGPTSSRQ